jgi:WD40 repeat protein
MSFLRDAERFILSFRPIIDVAPLQLYSSALSFAPTNSLVRKTFEACRSSWITRAPKVALQWSPNLQTLEGHGAWIQCVTFSSEGLLASGDQKGIVKIWDPISGTCLHTLRIGEEQIAVALAFSETGKLACMTESSISIWDANQCTYSHNLDYLRCRAYSIVNNPMAFLNDQRLLLVDRMKNKVLIWKPGHDIEEYNFGQHSHDSTPVLSFDGRWVAWVGKEEIKILKTFKSDCSPHVLAAAGEIDGTHGWTTCFSRDNQYFAFGNYIGTVMVWSITSSERIKVFKNNEDIRTMAFSPDNQILATGSFGARIAIWDWKKDICLQTLTGHHSCVTSLSYSLDGAWLASGSGDYRVTIWDATVPISRTTDTRSDHYINSITMTKGDQKMVTKSVTGKYKLWDAFGGEWISPPDDDGTASLVAVSANGNMLVTVSDSELRAWDLGTGDCLLKSKRPDLEIIQSIALSASGERLVLGIDSGEVELLESRTGQRFKKVHVRETRTIVRVAISPDGGQVASAVDDSVWVENILTGKFLALEFNESQTDGVGNIGFSQNGERLAAVTYLWAGIIWDLATGACLRKFSRGREGFGNVHVWRLDLSFINFDFAVVTGSPEEQLREDCLTKYHISFDGAWLMRHNEKLLWLPPDYRPSAAAASGSTIAIGCRLNSGYPIVIEISEDGP